MVKRLEDTGIHVPTYAAGSDDQVVLIPYIASIYEYHCVYIPVPLGPYTRPVVESIAMDESIGE